MPDMMAQCSRCSVEVDANPLRPENDLVVACQQVQILRRCQCSAIKISGQGGA